MEPRFDGDSIDLHGLYWNVFCRGADVMRDEIKVAIFWVFGLIFLFISIGQLIDMAGKIW